MATTRVTTTWQTGFESGSTRVQFGFLFPDTSLLMTDWARPSKTQDLEGANITVTQLLGFGPRRVTYRIFFETIADYQTLEGLVQTTGTLTVVGAGHTVTVTNTDSEHIHTKLYDHIPSVTLLSLTSAGVAPDGTVEADAIFQVSS
jgi:hypothetical protein